MKNIKYIIWVLVIIAWIVLVYFNFVVNPTNANPDYICIKNVDRSCEIDESKCPDWNTDGTRICEGKRVTQVAYYHTRTTCESGYTIQKRWWWYTSWASWRKTVDFNYATENCSIRQIDQNRPSWEVEQIN